MQEEIYDINGNPITFDEFRKIRTLNKRVALDNIDGVEVSTVWLGFNHQYGDGPPLIFETMIFGCSGDLDGYQERYSTLEQAQQGHKKATRLVMAALPDYQATC